MFDPETIMKIICVWALLMLIGYLGFTVGWKCLWSWYMRLCQRYPKRFKFTVTTREKKE